MSWNGKSRRLDKYKVEIDQSYQNEGMKRHGLTMSVPGLVYADDKMWDTIVTDNSPDQVANVATLPGIVGRSIAMPDIHHGYGFAIGGVAAFDADHGVISPGGVGYDINCGVRLVRTDLTFSDIQPSLRKLVETMFNNVPSGVGSSGRIKLSDKQIEEVLANGARWAVSNGYGWDEDLEYIEERGAFENSDPSVVSPNARKRGAPQLGSLGAGNHFLEIQQVDEIFNPEVAAAFGIVEKGQITIMIHTGSRGCGHQICTDYLDHMRRAQKKYDIPLVDRELTSAPVASPEGQQYYKAMQCGANFAWANRQMIMHWVRESFEQVLKQPSPRMGMHLIYDIAHNIAKLEEHEYEGRKRRVYVHRKGATRAFGPGHSEIPERYRQYGQPVLIPGDMGTASYLLVGTEQAMQDTWGSSCHGAGRRMSRKKSTKEHPADKVFADLEGRGIYLRAKSRRCVAEEAPGAYKNIESVIDISHHSGIARRVARMKPLGVVKG
ncbi:RNA-splicing ligase RtcB [candidate division GN15 bacterium]|nr:RNA-splicing ligase RtcB [candidate division GN15 bacterium]